MAGSDALMTSAATQDDESADAFERLRLRMYFARPKAITRDAWTELRARYLAWRAETLAPFVKALAGLVISDLRRNGL